MIEEDIQIRKADPVDHDSIIGTALALMIGEIICNFIELQICEYINFSGAFKSLDMLDQRF